MAGHERQSQDLNNDLIRCQWFRADAADVSGKYQETPHIEKKVNGNRQADSQKPLQFSEQRTNCFMDVEPATVVFRESDGDKYACRHQVCQ